MKHEKQADRLSEQEMLDVGYGRFPHHYEKLEGRTDWYVDFTHPDGSIRHHSVECKDRYGYNLAFLRREGLIVDVAKVRAQLATGRIPLMFIRTADLAMLVIDCRQCDGWTIREDFQRTLDWDVRHDRPDDVYLIPIADSMVRWPNWEAAATARMRRGDLTLHARAMFKDSIEGMGRVVRV